MRLLTIHQPWAWLICAGHKRYENRTWSTRYRGPVLIHAGASCASLRAGIDVADRLGIALPDDLRFGSVIGVATIADCTPVDFVSDPFATGPFCFHLVDPVLFSRPVAWKGALGLIEPSDALVEAINSAENL
jgi:hypothetical protein